MQLQRLYKAGLLCVTNFINVPVERHVALWAYAIAYYGHSFTMKLSRLKGVPGRFVIEIAMSPVAVVIVPTNHTTERSL
jgi:hypothetical protein